LAPKFLAEKLAFLQIRPENGFGGSAVVSQFFTLLPLLGIVANRARAITRAR
jgi:hypothetical protein